MSSSTMCIDPRVLKDRLDDVVVIDVRTPGEFESLRLPASRNRPLDELDDHRDEIRELVAGDHDVVLVCRSGARAHQAQERLTEAGLPTLPILEGGVIGWESADGEVVRDAIRWDLERQVRLVAGGVVAASIAVSVVYPPARFVAGLVGLGLTRAAVTNTCTLGMVLAKLPYNQPRSTT